MEKLELLPVTLKRTSDTVRPPVRRILALPPRLNAPEILRTNAEPAAPFSVNVPPFPLLPPPRTKLLKFMTYLPPNGVLSKLLLGFLPILSEVREPAVAVSPAAAIDTFLSEVTPPFSCELIVELEKREPVMVPVLLIDSVDVVCS